MVKEKGSEDNRQSYGVYGNVIRAMATCSPGAPRTIQRRICLEGGESGPFTKPTGEVRMCVCMKKVIVSAPKWLRIWSSMHTVGLFHCLYIYIHVNCIS